MDLGGHVVEANFTVVRDTTGPQIALIGPTGGGDRRGNIKFTVDASDASGLAGVYIRVKGGDWRPMMLDQSGKYIYTWGTGQGDDGVQSVDIMAKDKLGNEVISSFQLSVKNKVPDFWVDNFNWLVILVLIIGFAVLTVATLRRPKYTLPPEYLALLAETRHAPLPTPRVPEAAPPPAREPAPPPVPPPTPLPPSVERPTLRSRSAGDEVAFEEDEEFIEEAPAAKPAPKPALSLFGKPKAAPSPAPATAYAPRGGMAASLAAAAGAGGTAGGFEEIRDEGEVEELQMEEKAYMPSGSLPPAAELPRPLAAAPKAPPAETGVSWGEEKPVTDAWEEEGAAGAGAESASWEEEQDERGQRAAGPQASEARLGKEDRRSSGSGQEGYGSRPAAPGTPHPAPSARPPSVSPATPAGSVTPLDSLLYAQLKVTRSKDERARKGPPKGPPAGWTHPRPAELTQEAPPPPPSTPKPSVRGDVYAPAEAIKQIPPDAQKLSKKDREKMGVMLDDLLTKSRKK